MERDFAFGHQRRRHDRQRRIFRTVGFDRALQPGPAADAQRGVEPVQQVHRAPPAAPVRTDRTVSAARRRRADGVRQDAADCRGASITLRVISPPNRMFFARHLITDG